MKRKIFSVIKQMLCTHEFEFVECDFTRTSGYFPSWYFLYRCKKCGKYKNIYCHRVEEELEDIYPEKALEYPKDVLWLPKSYEDELIPQKFYSREAGYLVSKYYNKYGMLLTAWGNRKFGPMVDRDNLEMKSHDEIIDNVLSSIEVKQSMKNNGTIPPLFKKLLWRMIENECMSEKSNR